MAQFPLKVIRAGLSTLQRISPEAAGRLGLRIFTRTPGPAPKSAKEKAALEAAAERMKAAETMLLNFAGGQVAVHRFAPETVRRDPQRILVVHGWGSRTDYLIEMISSLTLSGCEVVALDLPGHGASPGRLLTMPMAIRAIDAAWRQFNGFDASIGHSFGGGALALAAAGVVCDIKPRVPEKLVLIGAPSEMTWLFKDFGRMMGFGGKAQQALERAIERLAGRPLADFDVAAHSGKLKRPVLVIHAEDDKEVPSLHARRYAAAGEGVVLHWANGFGHRRIVSAEPVLDRIAAFLGISETPMAA